MKALKRGIAAALAVLMLFAAVPMTALADDLPQPPDGVVDKSPPSAGGIADEVTYNVGHMEVTVRSDVNNGEDSSPDVEIDKNDAYIVDPDTENWENDDLDIWYDLFDENGGYTINLDLFEAEPLFPYEVQFKYQGKTETRWFETINDTVEVGGHVFSLSCTDSQPQAIGFWVAGEYFPARPAEKTFTNDGGFSLFSMQPLKENRTLNADLSSKLGNELKDVKVTGGPESGVWGILGSDSYHPFDGSTGIDLSPYFGMTTSIPLEIIDGDDPLNPNLMRYIVTIRLCDLSKLLEFQGYMGKVPAEAQVYVYANDYRLSMAYGSWPQWTLGGSSFRIRLGEDFPGYDVDVYNGNYATEAEVVAAGPDADITDQIWDDGSNAPGPGYELIYGDGGKPNMTFVFKKESKVVFIYNASVHCNYDWGPQTYYDICENFDAQLDIDGKWTSQESRWFWHADNLGQVMAFYREDAETYRQENSLRLRFSDKVSEDTGIPKIAVYQGGHYNNMEALQAAIDSGEAKDVTADVWGDEAPGIKHNYSVTNAASDSSYFTIRIGQGTIPDNVWDGEDILVPAWIQIRTPEFRFSDYGLGGLYYEVAGTASARRYYLDLIDWTELDPDPEKDDDKVTYILEPGQSTTDTYYFELRGQGNGNYVYSENCGQYVKKAVVGRCATAEEVLDGSREDIKDKLFSDASRAGGGYGTDYSKGVTFTVLDAFGELHYATVQVVASATVASPPNPLSDDTYFRIRGANSPTDGSPYQAYLMKSSDDGYYFNGYQTVFLLNGDGSAVTDATIYPTFWTGSKVNVYAALDTASGSKVESGKSQTRVTFGVPIHYSAGSESGTHLKNYWVTFVTQTDKGPDLFVNGVTNSEHLDEEDGLPVREIFLDISHGYYHDIFFANIGNAQMEGLSVTLSDDAQNIALDDYWQIKETDSLGAFTTVDSSKTPYGELPNVSKIRLVPKVVDGVISAGEISGTLTISYAGGKPVVIKLTGTAAKPKITTTSIVPGVKYVHYSSVIQTDNMYNTAGVTFKILKGNLPNGLILKPNGELYGVPTVTGDYTFTVQALYNGAECDTKEFTLRIEDNTDENVWNATDLNYDITTAIPNEDGSLTINTMNKGDNSFTNSTQLFVSEGEYPYFVELKLDSKLLQEGTDYTKDPGSTRITLQTQTLKNAGSGTHTLSAEFREGDTMKRAAQNYEIKPSQSSGGNTGSGSSGGYPSSGNTNSGTTSGSGTGNSGGQTPTTPGKPIISFVDVPATAWYYSEVAWAYENGFMLGVSDTKFEPNASIDQATVVTVLARMAKVDLNRFNAEGYDNITPGQWYSSAAVWATQAGLLPDYTIFIETGSISRGNMAIMLMKYLHSMGFDTSLPSPLVEFADADLMTQDEFCAFQVLYHYGIFLGVGGMRMDPTGITSRCEFSTLIHRLHTLLEK